MNSIEELIFSYTEIVRILRENNIKYDFPLSVAIRDRAIETYEQVIFDLEQIKNLPNELRAVNRNEQAKEKCDVCGCYPSVLIVTEFGTFCKEHARYV